jgi:hypothetical protein
MLCSLRVRASEYLRERSAQFEHELPGDCVDEAIHIAELLLAEGKRPWIGRIRDRRGDFAGLLYAWRFEGRQAIGWTTHYVCCEGDLAYDPLAGEPVPVGEFAARVFQKPLEIAHLLDVEDTPDIKASIRQAVYASSSTHHPGRPPSASS